MIGAGRGCFRRGLRWAVLLLGLAIGGGQTALAEGRPDLQLFGGQMSDNEWGDFFDDWGSMRWKNATLVGAGLNWEWPVWKIGYVGAEIQALKWFGEQNHFEFTAPIFIRTPRPRSKFIPSVAYGVGLSFATETPRSELARTGSSTQTLAHWFAELEFGNNESRWRPYLRLHHRSDAWGTFDADTGSNALVMGVRVTDLGVFR